METIEEVNHKYNLEYFSKEDYARDYNGIYINDLTEIIEYIKEDWKYLGDLDISEKNYKLKLFFGEDGVAVINEGFYLNLRANSPGSLKILCEGVGLPFDRLKIKNKKL